MDMSQHATLADKTEAGKTASADDRAARNAFVGLAAVLALWGSSTFLFGLGGLILPAIGMTAVAYVALVLLTKGR